MSAGFKVWNLLHNDYLTHNPHIAGAIVTSGLFIAGSAIYRMSTPKSKLSKTALSGVTEEELVPSEKISTRNIVESCAEYVRGQAKDIIGSHYASYLPLLSFVFMWILVNNLIGIIPGFGSPTDNINTTFSMGIFIFLYYNLQGIIHQKWKYLEQFTGHLHGALLLALGWLMFPLELISHCIRPLTLGLRLRINIFADHLVYETLSGLTLKLGEFLGEKFSFVGQIFGYVFAALAPVPIVLLGLIVCVVQALVFTLLSSVYIGIATAHEEH
jgi:F-type H+-transporting ATPase subunit a